MPQAGEHATWMGAVVVRRMSGAGRRAARACGVFEAALSRVAAAFRGLRSLGAGMMSLVAGLESLRVGRQPLFPPLLSKQHGIKPQQKQAKRLHSHAKGPQRCMKWP